MQPRAEIYLQDCITGMAERLAEASVHLTVTSIPFESLFVYTGKNEDLGNNPSERDLRAGRFALNLRFFANQLLRVTAPGCNACIHIQQLLAYKNQHGFMGRRDFRAAVVDVFAAEGWIWTGEFAIPKDPQVIANRLNLHSLQFKSGYARSSTLWAPAVNDYVLIFQRPGDPVVPVRPLKHKSNPRGWIVQDEWVRDAHGVWTDILEIDVLECAKSNKAMAKHRETEQEKHPCPLQLEVVRRLINLYSNPIDVQPDVTVLDPFVGLGTVAWVALGGASPITKLALHAPRNVVGFELKESYHRAAMANVEKVFRLRQQKHESNGVLKSLFASQGAT